MEPYAAYLKRRDGFVTRRERAKSDHLTKESAEVIFHTDLCMATFRDFVSAQDEAEQKLSKLNEAFDTHRSESSARLETVREIADRASESAPVPEEFTKLAESDPEVRASLELLKASEEYVAALTESTVKVIEQQTQNAETLQTGINILRTLSRQVVTERVEQSLLDFYRAKSSKALAANVISFAEFLIGLTPAGPFIDAVQRIKEGFEREPDRFATTDVVLLYLENYKKTAVGWCVLTQSVIDTLKQPNRDRPISVEDSGSRVAERGNTLRSGWNYQVPLPPNG